MGSRPDCTEGSSAYLVHCIDPGSGGDGMLGSGIIEVAIGLAFVFGVTAALSSVFTELIARFLGLRGEYLLRGLRELLDGADGQTALSDAIRNYEEMKGLVEGPAPGAGGGPAA